MSGTFHTKYSIDSIRISGDHKYVLCAQSKLNGAIWGGRIDVLDISMKRTAAAEAESVRFVIIQYRNFKAHTRI